ncbi:MAG: 4-hydroxy-tetrahydrodipicolinate synthase [Proteobacteria bacterium]|jgi:4-hydroxy-tetrahydrodipicolinate synthase|nr:4-hydroxy-tetrahydrodipicolinate synthase [Pseudomonadota bacterium]MBT5064643.1 4-hydroxy-tetrahydrodipicolinate synthase [Pseudomonadota bacterium]MBT6192808.1 4-hydroxy-tetrahydrodipicolinate synthase [Pseudomonadota bacterium]MBT6465030.1 4-hydroxy-tetrahydrodipicolinate synthase [Pseudomonadota bacterium]MBT6673631.1 4-hydroxy-tetrahydrodipicolinate synthase [Pseudomonadota bacterium]
MISIQGSIVAIVTPMKSGCGPETEIDFSRLAELIDFHVENQTDGIVVAGTTGESATLTDQEHCDLIARAVKLAKGRIPVIAGTGANSTHEAIRLTAFAKEAGVDACLLVTPYYNKPTQEGLYLHHKMIAESVATPQILYNVPGRTACDMLPDTVGRLSGIANIIGVKEATGDLSRVAAIKSKCRKGFLLFSGDDETACDFLLEGGDGVISVTSNVAPKKMRDLCIAARSGQIGLAKEIDRQLSALHKNLFLEANPIAVKWALAEMGLVDQGIRLPLTWLSSLYHEQVRDALRQAEV